MDVEAKDYNSLNLSEEQEEKMINEAFQDVLDGYLRSNHRKKVEIIKRAYEFAKNAHKGIRRRSGEPYILHPIAVAKIVSQEIGLGSTSICSALLHDVVEDTEYTVEDIEINFGKKIASIVDGLTKISGGIFGDKASAQAENFRKLLLTMADDIRVILIKMADRLHNMRTLSSMLPNKQYKIAGETLYIFAPLADRLGLNKIKTELENLSFKYEHPEEYAEIEKQLAQTQPERDTIFDKFTPPIRQALDEIGMKYTIKARIKSPYSIWRKMQNKHVSFAEVFDILAIRIVFTPKNRAEEVNECYRIYSALTQIYTPHPQRFRDWLSNPKANGYQALHNTFMSKQGKWIEVQIRSDRMDDIAEQGFAAHWKYKEAGAAYDENELDRWLNSIKEILDDPQPDTLDLLDTIKLNLFTSEIMVFTPKGELKTMPAGSTALDFAFSIHSFLGSHCFGAKVNHKLVPLSYKLRSGDQIEIITSRTQHVQPEWLSFATTAKAKGKIQAILRRENREKQQKGQQQLKQFFEDRELEYSIPNIDKLVAFHELTKREELYQAIGSGSLTPSDDDVDLLRGKKRGSGWRKYIPFIGRKEAKVSHQVDKDFAKNLNRKQILTLDEAVLDKCIIAPCCHPIPGDDVMGYINAQGILEIHARSCEHATKLKTRYGNNIIATRWDTHKEKLFDALIGIKGVDSQGVLYAIADVLRGMSQFTVKRITLETTDGIFEGKIQVTVHDTEDVKLICDALKKIENVLKAVRLFDAE